MAGLFDIFSNDNAEQAARDRNSGLQQGYDALSTQFGQGRDALSAGYGKAGDIYAGLGSKFDSMYGGGAGAYGDATGANGAAGYGRATANFQTNPGYQFQMDQGQQAINRAHQANGSGVSGGLDADTLKFSQGLADQAYGSYVNRLQPYLGFQGQGATTAAAGQAGAAAGQGAGLNQSYQGQGTAANSNYTGQGASTAATDMNNYNISQNMWNGIGKAVNVGSSLFGAFA